ncbi:hypothetical protein GCM10009819_21470 [Agromyces tropicus]|uniref:DUF7882 domain-containing protein n=1 Tax=Agromyces tropicus TaxID=555371 RepID=A0ABN2UHW6_9MICO
MYDGRLSIPIDDRALAHLQVVILAKLRRRESFGFTVEVDGRETSVWIGPSAALEFDYADRRRPAINRAWLELLAATAASQDGLVVAPEPPQERAPDPGEAPRRPRGPVVPLRPLPDAA